MNSGFCFGDGYQYVFEESDALSIAKELGYSSLEEAYDDDAYYYTTWGSDDLQYVSNYADGRDAVEMEGGDQ